MANITPIEESELRLKLAKLLQLYLGVENQEKIGKIIDDVLESIKED